MLLEYKFLHTPIFVMDQDLILKIFLFNLNQTADTNTLQAYFYSFVNACLKTKKKPFSSSM